MHAASQKAQNAEELEEQRNIELSQMKESLKGELESKMYEIFQGRISSEIENRMMQRFEKRMNEERKEWNDEVRELKFENQQLRQIIKDC
jgi:cell division protein YceG involved in septum cleavage